MHSPAHAASALDALAAHFAGMPPVAAMRPAIADWRDGHLRLSAPLAANVNDKGCAFGGSLVSLMTIAAWGLVSLELAQAGLQLPQRRARMGEVTRAVRGGASLADALEDHDALTATGYNLVRVGERSGKIAAMLDSLARLYEEAGRNRMKRVLILLEPIAILIIGSVIGTIILGVILAITSANDLAV